MESLEVHLPAPSLAAERTDFVMTHDFDPVAKRLWFMDNNAARLVAQLPQKDRRSIEECLRSLYGASIDLSGSESDIRFAIERLRR